MTRPSARFRLVWIAVVFAVGLACFAAVGPACGQDPASQDPAPQDPPRRLGPQPTDPDDPVVPPLGPEDRWVFGPDDPAGVAPTDSASDGTSESNASSVEIVRARMKGELGHRWVRSIGRLEPGGARPDWSVQGDRLAYDADGDLGFRVVYVRDLERGSRHCVTCDLWELREKNVLAPTWHPSGDWLVVLVQELPRRLLAQPEDMAGIRRGLHADLWILSADGKYAWRLTRSSDQGRAVLDAQISFEGDRMAWSERIDSTVRPDGAWVVRIADLDLGKVPSIHRVQTLRPTSWPARVTVDGFTEDDSGLWLSVSPRDRRGSVAMRYDLETLRSELVDNGGTWNLEPRTVPRGERIVFASDRNTGEARALPYRSELWFTTPLALRQERLTFFNDPNSDHSLGEAMITDAAWSPDGLSLVISMVSTETGLPREALWRVDLSAGIQGGSDGPPLR